MILSEILNLKISDIVAMFKKKPDVWYEFSIRNDYDLTKHPEISPKSPIKDFSITYCYRYCPDKRLLHRRSFTTGEWYKKETYTLEIKAEMDKIDFKHNRDKKINKILK